MNYDVAKTTDYGGKPAPTWILNGFDFPGYHNAFLSVSQKTNMYSYHSVYNLTNLGNFLLYCKSHYLIELRRSSFPELTRYMISSPKREFCHANHSRVKSAASSLWKDS